MGLLDHWPVCDLHGSYDPLQGCCPYCIGYTPRDAAQAEVEGVDATLAERGARYGDFTDHAKIADAMLAIAEGNSPVLKVATSWQRMKPFQREGIRMIIHKLARALNGDPDYADNFHDIQGYAKLVEERLG